MTNLTSCVAFGAFGLVCLLNPEVAFAVSCDMAAIKGASVNDTAKQLLSLSDVVGVGGITEHQSSDGRLWQSVKFSKSFKGNVKEVNLAPYRTGRVSVQDGYTRRFYFGRDESRVYALVRKEDGLASAPCITAAVGAYSQVELTEALARLTKADARERPIEN